MKKRQENQGFFEFLIFKKSKKGTHVGIVISFVMFVIFLVFLYAAIQPAIRIKINEQNLLNFLEDDLISLVSSDMTTVSVKVDGTLTKPCLKLNSLITRTQIDTNIIVKNDSKDSFNSHFIGGGGDLGLLIDRTGSETTFFKVIVAEEFTQITSDPGSFNCDTLELNEYTIGSTRTNKYIFESKIKDLMRSYEIDYLGTKNALNISTKNDFGFGFTYSNGTIIKTRGVNVSVVIYAKEVSIMYIDTKANISSGNLNVRLW